uniref:Uncharacterized protein n=1 Tax=Rhizophora mucronata TaxID=61149 RepID=A0A2P2QEQ1_RHIMU
MILETWSHKERQPKNGFLPVTTVAGTLICLTRTAVEQTIHLLTLSIQENEDLDKYLK